MDSYQKFEELKKSPWFNEFYFIAIALILAFGTIQTTGNLMDTERPVVTVVSCSMYPDYNVGDIVIVQGQSFDNYEVGDVIVFDAESENVNIPVIHRVIEKRDRSLETQGDNTRGQHDFEQNITSDQVYGEAVFKVPRIGLVKILAMDILGYSGDRPLVIDNTPQCRKVA